MDQRHKKEIQNIQNRLKRSREQFIEELEAQDEEVSRRLIDEFLHEQLGPSEKRSPIAQQEARETVQLIKFFDSHTTSITTQIAIAINAYEQTLASLHTYALRKNMELYGTPGGAVNFKKATEKITQRVVQCGEHLDFVQRLASVVLLAYRSTILEFTGEALDVSWREVVSRIRRELATSTKSELFDQSFELLKKELGELAKDISEEYIDGFRKYWRMLCRLLGKKNIPKFGRTDLMQRLLHELRQQERLIAQLESSYGNALEVLLAQVPTGDTC